MYLFTRSIRLGAGRLSDQMAWCLSMTEKVNQVTELDVGLWTTVFSPALGTVVWTAAAEDLELLELTDTKLMADSGYLNLVDEGAQHLSADPINDTLMQYVVPGDPDQAGLSQYASVARSVLAPGHIVSGVGVGVEIAERATRISGASTAFCLDVTGVYGGVAWITGHESVQALQRATEAINAEASFAEYIDANGSQAFVASATTQTVYRRIV